jgi:hypothetical protein
MFSQQALILTICNVVILIAVILSMFVLKKSKDNDRYKLSTILKNIAALVMFIIIMVMQIYSVNCMIYGDCHLWTWILVAFAAFGTLMYIGFFAYIAMSANRIKTSITDLPKLDFDNEKEDLPEFGAPLPKLSSSTSKI